MFALHSLKKNQTFRIYCISFLILAIAASGYFIYIYHNNTVAETFEINLGDDPNSSYSVVIDCSKEWKSPEKDPVKRTGCEYDGVLTNHTQSTLTNWKITLELGTSSIIDSSWNGDFILDGETLAIVCPSDFNNILEPGKSVTFGWVMYTIVPLEFRQCILTANFYTPFYSTPFFRLLCLLGGIWIIGFISTLVTHIRTYNYKLTQEKDEQIILQSMKTFSGFIDAKDSYTNGHSSRVAAYAREIGRRMKLEDDKLTNLYYIALLHDCGKVGIPDVVLNKTESLTDEEWDIIRSHTTVGGEVLKDFTAIEGIREGALFHHERFDGRGYPNGLSGEEIPLNARIICIADCYDAMSSERCYRKPFDDNKIIEEFQSNAGTQFDPDLIPYIIEMIQDGFTLTIKP